ncbi:restriction endonuclease subunit S [Vibrio cholerae]
MEQVLYKLPDGWEWMQLGEALDVRDGTHDSPKYVESGFPLVTSKNITGKGLDVQNVKYISKEDFDAINKRSKVDVGDILFAMIGTIGFPTVITDEPNYAIKNVALFKKRQDDQNMDFFKYFLESPYAIESMLAQARGAAQKFVGLKVLRSFNVPLPPKVEQKRIVEKLDALLTRIDTAIEHLQSKLDLSKQLFDSVLDEFFKLSDCDSVPLTEVVDFIGGSQPPKSQFSDVQKEGYVRLIQIRDYKTDNHIVYVDSASTKKFCTKDDVMIGRYGPPVFQILRGLDGAYNVALMKAVPNEDVLTKDYLFWFLQSPSIQNYVIGISQRAAGQSGVNKKALEKYLIPVPSKTIQNDIVDKVGQLVNKSRSLEAEVTAEITSLNQLKASILDSAFKGEL